MRNNVLFTLLHDVWGESASESLRLVMMRLDEEMLCAADLDQLSQAVPELPKEKWQAWCEYYSPERASLREKLLADMHIQVLCGSGLSSVLKGSVQATESALYQRTVSASFSEHRHGWQPSCDAVREKCFLHTGEKPFGRRRLHHQRPRERDRRQRPQGRDRRPRRHDRCAGLRHRQDLPA